MPTSMRITPTVWRSMPETCAVTAYFRIAPTAISRMDVPMVMRQTIPTGPAAQPSATSAPDDGSIVRGGHGRGPARKSRPPRSDLRGPSSAPEQHGAHLNPESDPTDSGGGSPMRQEVRDNPARLLLAALLLALALIPAARPTPAAASPTQASILQDDPQLLYVSASHRSKRLSELKSLGVDVVKVQLRWRDMAPKKRPRGFNGADPNRYDWTPYDAIVSGAQSRGMGVLFQLGGNAPEWA